MEQTRSGGHGSRGVPAHLIQAVGAHLTQKIRSSSFPQTTIPVDRHRHLLPLGRTPQGIVSLPRNGSRRYRASDLAHRRQELSEPNPTTLKALRKSFGKHIHPPAYPRSESNWKGVIPQPHPRVRRRRRGRHSRPQHHPTGSTRSTITTLLPLILLIFVMIIIFQRPPNSSNPLE
jgi:hypothetical protein